MFSIEIEIGWKFQERWLSKIWNGTSCGRTTAYDNASTKQTTTSATTNGESDAAEIGQPIHSKPGRE